jgi:four helix bundle protein
MTSNKKDPNKTFRFRNFQVYKDARNFSKELKKFSKSKFPKEEQFGLLSQLWRALDSVMLNIAEGSDRGTDKDFALFLNRSHTSLNEVVAC